MFALSVFYIYYKASSKYGLLVEPLTSNSIEQGRSFRPLSISIILFVLWFVLYGGASQWQQYVLGILFSGLILVFLVLRLFSRVRPIDNNTGRFDWIVRFVRRGNSAIPDELKYESAPEEGSSERGALIGHTVMLRFNRNIALRAAFLLRGPRARDRITTFVFLEYIFSLLIVAAAAILFWALIISVAGTEILPLADSFRRSAGYFLPGIQPPGVGVDLPYWASIGPAATSWILFVLYLAPAGSVLPHRQSAAQTELLNTYRTIRAHILKTSRMIRSRERILNSE